MACSLSLKEEFLTCAICTEFYTDPCTLGCQHSFCRKCLTDYIKTRTDAVQLMKIPCAFCRQDTSVPNPTMPVDEWAGQFKPSLMLKGLMDRLQSGHKHREGQDICFLCDEVGETTPSTSWCYDCEVTLCSRCAKMHLKTPSLKKHDLRDLSEVAKVKQRRKVKCSEHEGELIKYICRDCNKSVCQICSTIKHRACRHVVTIESMMPEIKSALTEEKRNLEKRMQDNMAYMKQEETKLQQLKDKEKTIGSNIKSEIESVMSLLRKKERKLLKDLGDATNKHISQHKANIKSGQITTKPLCKRKYSPQLILSYVCFSIAHISRCRQSIEKRVLQCESEMEMYEMYQVCQSGVVTSVGDMESDTKNTSVVKDVTFTPNIEPLRKAITEIGGVDVTFMKHDTPKLGTRHKLTSKSATLSTPVFCDTIDIKRRDDRRNPDPIDVTVLIVNGVITVVTADYGNKRLKSVFTENCRKRFSVLELSGLPLCIDRMTEHRVATTVSDSHIVIADARPELVLVSKLKTSKKYRGLTALSESSLAAGSSLPPGIDILDLSGNVIRSFTPHNTGLDRLQHPRYMCTTQEGNILVADYDSQSVYCMTSQGDVDFTNTPTGHGQPVGVTVTDTGDILLSTGNPFSVILLTSCGTFIRNILTSKDNIIRPWGMCVYDRDKLYLCDRGDGCIKVFTHV